MRTNDYVLHRVVPAHMPHVRFALPNDQPFTRTTFPRLTALAPWLIAAFAIMALTVAISRGNARTGSEFPLDQYPIAAGAQIADGASQRGIDLLESKVDNLARKLEASRTPAKVRTPKPKEEPPEDPSVVALGHDLEKLRQLVTDVEISISEIDSQVSDPAVLQKKLEHQKALIRK